MAQSPFLLKGTERLCLEWNKRNGPNAKAVILCPSVAWVFFLSRPSTMALQQAQMLLSMNSLEAVNVGVQQNNTESFAVVLCHLAELHAEQVGGAFLWAEISRYCLV